ncbi:MAG TPA: hypothetical protein VJM15_06460 [Sphingomicrobium sp.]|nr:hypothetical protein [Sphingomicrobium sp.]
MSDEELESALATATLVSEGGYDSDDDADDYVIASLYKAADGRHFRHVTSSGMNSPYDGSGNVGEWLDAADIGNWEQFR